MFHNKMVFLLFAFVPAYFVACADAEKYDNRYDYIDFKGILDQHKSRQRYYECFVSEEKGRCRTADAKFFWDILPEIIRTNCAKCTERQKSAFDAISEFYNSTDSLKKCYDAIIRIATKRAVSKLVDKDGREIVIEAPPAHEC